MDGVVYEFGRAARPVRDQPDRLIEDVLLDALLGSAQAPQQRGLDAQRLAWTSRSVTSCSVPLSGAGLCPAARSGRLRAKLSYQATMCARTSRALHFG